MPVELGRARLVALSCATFYGIRQIAVLAIWSCISLPLTLVGTVVGKNWNGTLLHLSCRSAPQGRRMELKSHDAGTPEKVRINQVPRQIPEKRWYLQPWVHILLGGVLPFGSIFIEMYFIFTSFYKYYYVYGFMLLVYVILIIVTGTSSSPHAVLVVRHGASCLFYHSLRDHRVHVLPAQLGRLSLAVDLLPLCCLHCWVRLQFSAYTNSGGLH